MARRKLTKTEELPQLTDKQMKFCEGILSGLSQSAAYRQAYDCQNMSDNAIWCEASRLRHDSKVALWLDAARSDTLKTHECTFDGHLSELERLKGIAIRTGNIGAAVQAEQLRGKAAGHYVEQFADVTPDPLQTLNEIAKLFGEETARKAAEAEGIHWQPEYVAKGMKSIWKKEQ